MFNLLPQEHQEELRKEYARRRRVLILWALLLLGISALLTLFPAYIISVEKEKEVSLDERTETEMYKEDISDLNQILSNLKSNTAILISGTLEVSVQGLFAKIIDSKSSEIAIKSLVYKKQGEVEPMQIAIVGVAETRDGLLSFARALESIEIFSKVDVPVSNFAKDRNIEFTLELTEAKKQ